MLGLSVAPELLVLAPPSPSPTKLGDSLTATTASSGTGPSMLSASTSSAPESRRLSTPAQSASSALSTVSSPRRALSAQPTGAIPRDKLPSPRRVLPVMRNVAPTVASAGTPLRTASRVFPVLTSKVSLAAGTLAPLANTAATIQSGSGQQVLADDAPPRRSQRSARPQRAVQAIKKEASSASLGSTASAPNTKPAVTPAQVQALTNQNTSANRKLYNKHKVTVIHKDEERPPSPTSKIRKTGEHAPKDNKAVRTALAQAARGDQQPGESSPSLGEKRPHFSAAGDEGIYESPVKKMRLDAADLDDGHGKQRSKSLKWDRDLLKPTEKLYTPPGHGTGVATKLPPRPAVKVSNQRYEAVVEAHLDFLLQNRALGLDSFGNVPDCKTSLSPIVPRTKVEISKIIYRDDDLDDDEE